MSRQAYRLERQLPAIVRGAENRLGGPRPAQAVWQLAAKQSDFGHLVVSGYREGRYSPIASLVRTLYEDASLLAWCAAPDAPTKQASRVFRVLVDYYRRAKQRHEVIPPDADLMLRETSGRAARKPPSMEDRARQLDADEGAKSDGQPFWTSHLDHVAMLNEYVHAELGGAPQFVQPKFRELLGFEALVYGHQYLTLSLISTVRLSDLNVLAKRAQRVFDGIHGQEMTQLDRLMEQRGIPFRSGS
jgi:hypothetical protein